MTNQNPLQKFFRQPKIFISLPSKGLYYPPGSLIGDYNNAPIFAMTGMDEIVFKTPDALFSGDATAHVIESCCPFIKNAKAMPSIDLDSLLIAIRIATFGNIMSVNHTCNNCQTDNTYDIDLSTLVDYFSGLTFVNTVQISDELTLKIKPLCYDEVNYFAIENFKLQKLLYQSKELKEEDRQKQLDLIYKELSNLQLQLFLKSIEMVQLTGAVVTEKQYIEEWLKNTERDVYDKIKTKLEENKAHWNIPLQPVRCNSCQTDDKITVVLDQSNFFG